MVVRNELNEFKSRSYSHFGFELNAMEEAEEREVKQALQALTDAIAKLPDGTLVWFLCVLLCFVFFFTTINH